MNTESSAESQLVSTEVEHKPEALKITNSDTSLANVTDEEWRLDVWRSYGSRVVQLPSPIGCTESPSAIFLSSSAKPSTPVELWSPSSDDMPWGPDSPIERRKPDADYRLAEVRESGR
jgi:hypothetical protein